MAPFFTTFGSGSSRGFGQRADSGIPDVTAGIQSFTSSGTFTVQSGVHYNNLIFRVYGAGGGGGGAQNKPIKGGSS